MTQWTTYRSSRSPSRHRPQCACRCRSWRCTARSTHWFSTRHHHLHAVSAPSPPFPQTFHTSHMHACVRVSWSFPWTSVQMSASSRDFINRGERPYMFGHRKSVGVNAGSAAGAHGGAPVAGPAVVDGNGVYHQHVGCVLEVAASHVSRLHVKPLMRIAKQARDTQKASRGADSHDSECIM